MKFKVGDKVYAEKYREVFTVVGIGPHRSKDLQCYAISDSLSMDIMNYNSWDDVEVLVNTFPDVLFCKELINKISKVEISGVWSSWATLKLATIPDSKLARNLYKNQIDKIENNKIYLK